MAKILLVDDEADLRKALTMILRSRKYDVTPAADGREAERLIQIGAYDLIVSDIRMTPVDGLHLLRVVQETHPETPVILITAYATLDIALDAVKAGAFDFVTKPFQTENFLATVARALDYPRIVAGNIQLNPAVRGPYDSLIVKSLDMQALGRRLEQLALTDEAVLILGERGAGKRQVAQVLHRLSRRKERPFVAVDCSAGAHAELKARLWGQGTRPGQAGALETAAGGTVLLEYIEELPALEQPEVLRLIKARENVPNITGRPADVRILATCRVLPMVQAGDDPERAHWIQTLAAIALRVPPLRERQADLLALISQAVYSRAEALGESWKLSARAYDILERYAWPRNVDELKQTMLAAMATARDRVIDVSDLPRQLTETAARMSALSQQPLQREELRGKSFRDYIRIKQKELSPALGAEDKNSGAKARPG